MQVFSNLDMKKSFISAEYDKGEIDILGLRNDFVQVRVIWYWTPWPKKALEKKNKYLKHEGFHITTFAVSYAHLFLYESFSDSRTFYSFMLSVALFVIMAFPYMTHYYYLSQW